MSGPVGEHPAGLAPVLAAGGRGGGEAVGALVGALSVSLTSSSTRSLIEPAQPAVADRHRGERRRAGRGRPPRAATRPTAAATPIGSTAPVPARRSPRGRRAGAARTISSTSRPKSPATLSRAASGWSVFENASRDRAHAPTAPAAAAGRQEHREAAQPQRHEREPGDRRDRGGGERSARLSEQDREDAHAHRRDRRARARACCPVRREPSQSSPGTASAAVVPTAFQYWNGAPMRLESSFAARVAGQTREASA